MESLPTSDSAYFVGRLTILCRSGQLSLSLGDTNQNKARHSADFSFRIVVAVPLTPFILRLPESRSAPSQHASTWSRSLSKQLTKSSKPTLFAQIPGGIASRYELRKSLVMIAGYLFVAVLPDRMADGVFDRLAKNRRARFHARLNRDPVVERMSVLLDGLCSETEIRACAERYHEWRIEDLWGRWKASHKSKWQIRTEVLGLEHVTSALNKGRGVVFWGMSFCGTLFPKIALSKAGVALTQLSTADHGAWFPLTLLGKWVVGPLHCLPEGRYLSERIRIPVDGNNNYLYRLGDVLKNRGCVWIAGERSRAKKLVAVDLLGHSGGLPVGAPTLARRHNAALLPVHTERLGRFHYRVTIEAPIQLERSMRRNEMINQAVQEYAQRLTDRILKCPGDWDWNHLWVKSLLSNRSED